jgi:hypothetical protein
MIVYDLNIYAMIEVLLDLKVALVRLVLEDYKDLKVQ